MRATLRLPTLLLLAPGISFGLGLARPLRIAEFLLVRMQLIPEEQADSYSTHAIARLYSRLRR